MKHIVTKIVCVILVAFSTHQLRAQKAEAPNFTYNFGGKIDFMKLTDSGVLVVANGDGFAGIKPGQDKLHFDFNDYGKVKEEELEFIPMSPYVIVAQGGVFTSKKSVIDFVAGKKLFATEENGWKLTYTCNIVLPQNKLVVSGQRKAAEQYAMAVAIYDLVSGKEEKLFKLKGAATMVTGRPLMVGDGIIVPTSKSLMHIDTKSGNITWETKVDDITWMTADATGKEIYAFEEKPGGDTKIHKISNTGQVLWKEAQKVKGKVSNFQILPQGLAVVSDVADTGSKSVFAAAAESKIGFMSAATGEDLWDKAPKTKGYVQHFYVMEDGILFGIREGGINKISFDGKTLFKKPLKTGENIHTMALTPKGMIYITDTDADIINLTTGESIWNKPIKYKKAKSVCSTYDANNKRYLISTGEEMLAIDENSGDISTFCNYKFEEKETPTALQVRDGGLLLTSDQNVMMLNFDGSKKFHEYHRSPGKSAFGAIIAGAMAVTSMAVATSAAYEAGMNKNAIGQYNDRGQQAKNIQDSFSQIASASFAEMNKRFKATAATENAQFILTKLDDGVGLVKVDKDSGKKHKEIVLKDKKPEYVVDEIAGVLYYRANDKSIYGYDLMN
ncbi:outer membrane protein assembly factor BamB family protein [Flavobacterium soli]|uniref:outer membrane protein assembly factor BamB family protein n=1 Tax=Flavobacterium soli TaxID=344881 RepID=UPI0003FC8B4F|nr:PQQ-binding-like beta-propeller repeat protein [Flavobacterium soli]